MNVLLKAAAAVGEAVVGLILMVPLTVLGLLAWVIVGVRRLIAPKEPNLTAEEWNPDFIDRW